MRKLSSLAAYLKQRLLKRWDPMFPPLERIPLLSSSLVLNSPEDRSLSSSIVASFDVKPLTQEEVVYLPWFILMVSESERFDHDGFSTHHRGFITRIAQESLNYTVPELIPEDLLLDLGEEMDFPMLYKMAIGGTVCRPPGPGLYSRLLLESHNLPRKPSFLREARRILSKWCGLYRDPIVDLCRLQYFLAAWCFSGEEYNRGLIFKIYSNLDHPYAPSFWRFLQFVFTSIQDELELDWLLAGLFRAHAPDTELIQDLITYNFTSYTRIRLGI